MKQDTSTTQQEASPVQQRFLTVAQYAKRVAFCPRTIQNLMRRRVIPYMKIGRGVRIDALRADAALQKYEIREVRP